MLFSITSLLTSLLFGTLILVFQRFLLRVTNEQQTINSKILTIFNFLFIFRVLFPFEFGYTITIVSKRFLPAVKDIFHFHLGTFFQYEVTILTILLILWISGSLVKLYFLGKEYLKIQRFIDQTSEYQLGILAEGKKFKGVHSFRVVEGLDSPVVIGLRRPTVLLPKVDFTEKELNYILTHEALHVSNLDLFVKYFYEFIIVIYWWNPLMYLFREQMDNVIELKTDEQLVAELTKEERIEYIQTLVKVRENQLNKRKIGNYAFSFSYGTKNQLLSRSRHILAGKQKSYSFLSLTMFGLLGVFLSTSVIFEPHRIKQTDVGESFVITSENNYLVARSDGQYELYMDGQFLTVLTQEQLAENEEFQKIKIYQGENSLNEKD